MDSGFELLEFRSRFPYSQKSKVLGLWVTDFAFSVLSFGLWVLDLRFWTLHFTFEFLDCAIGILYFGLWVLDVSFGFWALDFAL